MGFLNALRGFGPGLEDEEDEEVGEGGLDLRSRFFGKAGVDEDGAADDLTVQGKGKFSGLRGFTQTQRTIENQRQVDESNAEAERLRKENEFKSSRAGAIQHSLSGQLEQMKKKRSSLNRSGVGLDGAPIASQILMGR